LKEGAAGAFFGTCSTPWFSLLLCGLFDFFDKKFGNFMSIIAVPFSDRLITRFSHLEDANPATTFMILLCDLKRR
jgi:hypothetical protein